MPVPVHPESESVSIVIQSGGNAPHLSEADIESTRD